MTDAWTDPSAPAPRGRNVLTQGEWDALRRDYLIGYTGRDLAERFGVGLSTIREKAQRDGWRRRDRPEDPDLLLINEPSADDIPPVGRDPFDPVIADVEDWSDMTTGVRTSLRRAIKAGKPVEAASWMRLYERLRTRTLAAAEARDEDSPAETAPPPPRPRLRARPDALDLAMEKALRVDKLAQQATRALNSGDAAALAEVEAAVAELNGERPRPENGRLGAEAILATLHAEMEAALDLMRDPDSLDSPDSLDPVFSESR